MYGRYGVAFPAPDGIYDPRTQDKVDRDDDNPSATSWGVAYDIPSAKTSRTILQLQSMARD